MEINIQFKPNRKTIDEIPRIDKQKVLTFLSTLRIRATLPEDNENVDTFNSAVINNVLRQFAAWGTHSGINDKYVSSSSFPETSLPLRYEGVKIGEGEHTIRLLNGANLIDTVYLELWPDVAEQDGGWPIENVSVDGRLTLNDRDKKRIAYIASFGKDHSWGSSEDIKGIQGISHHTQKRGNHTVFFKWEDGTLTIYGIGAHSGGDGVGNDQYSFTWYDGKKGSYKR